MKSMKNNSHLCVLWPSCLCQQEGGGLGTCLFSQRLPTLLQPLPSVLQLPANHRDYSHTSSLCLCHSPQNVQDSWEISYLWTFRPHVSLGALSLTVSLTLLQILKTFLYAPGSSQLIISRSPAIFSYPLFLCSLHLCSQWNLTFQFSFPFWFVLLFYRLYWGDISS